MIGICFERCMAVALLKSLSLILSSKPLDVLAGTTMVFTIVKINFLKPVAVLVRSVSEEPVEILVDASGCHL